MIEFILLTIYATGAGLLALYTLGHGVMLVQHWRHRDDRRLTPSVEADAWPTVTVQLPIYNEPQVALRLLEAVRALDYAPERLTVQILDDSLDHTARLIADRLHRWNDPRFEHLRRSERTGFKAGALAHGLQRTDAEYVVIFDADFIPSPDFLRRTVPYLLRDAGLAVVQTRWEHLNADENPLTAAQALSIDTHFLIEQHSRDRSGWFLPFNGTGGVWRVQAIHEAGGWSAETLTEDLDLSFRAQLRGWRSLYLPQIAVPGELPPGVAAYRQQQARWAQGSAQCLRRLAAPIWTVRDVPLMTRLMATQHLAQYVPHLLMLILFLLAPPLLLLDALRELPLAWLGIVGLIPPLMYISSQTLPHSGGWRRLGAFPVLLLVGTGLIANHALAVVRGLFVDGGTFQRTPKFAQAGLVSLSPVGGQQWLEMVLAGYAGWGAWLAWHHLPALVPYLLLHAVAFSTVACWDAVAARWHQMTSDTPRLTTNPDHHPD